MPSTVTFPKPVLEAYKKHKLAVLFGSGLSMGVPGNFPTWTGLPARLLDLAEDQDIWTPEQIASKRAFFKAGHLSLEAMLAELDSLKEALGGAQGYRAALTSLFRPKDGRPGAVHEALARLGIPVVLTTNYDRLFEAADPTRIAYTWQKADKALADIQRDEPVLFKIHGSAEDDDSVVMTRREYDQAAASRPYQRAMSWLLETYTFLLVGYGINDPFDLDLVFGLNKDAFGSANRRHYALVQKDVAAPHRDRWSREMNIQVVEYGDHGDLPAILGALGGAKPNLR